MQLTTFRKILVGVAFLLSSNCYADVAATAMHEIFFGSSVIAEVKITSHSDANFRMKILNIHHDSGFGLHRGDYVKIEKDIHVIASSESVSNSAILQRSSGIVFLKKTANGWRVRKFCIQTSESKRVQLHFRGCTIEGTPSEIRLQIQQYFQEFRYSESAGIVGRTSAKDLKKSNLYPLVLLQYSRVYLGEVDVSIYQRIGCFDEAPLDK